MKRRILAAVALLLTLLLTSMLIGCVNGSDPGEQAPGGDGEGTEGGAEGGDSGNDEGDSPKPEEPKTEEKVQLPAVVLDSGTFGENNSLKWEITSQGEFIVSGTGAIPDFKWDSDIPWINWITGISNYNIRKITVNEGVTRIGDNAFHYFWDLESVSIANTVTSLGDAFRADSIVSITIPESVTHIDENALKSLAAAEIINLSNVEIPLESCDALTVHSGESKIKEQGGCFFYTHGETNYLVGIKDLCNLDRVVLPESYNGETYEIYRTVINWDTELVSLTIPAGVTAIDPEIGGGQVLEIINKSSVELTDDYYITENAIIIHSGESLVEKRGDYLFFPYEGEILLVGYEGTSPDLVLPESYDGRSYIYTGMESSSRYDVRSLTVPNGMLQCLSDNLPFFANTTLEKITVNGAFSAWLYNCHSLKTLVIGESASGADELFISCPDNVTIEISESNPSYKLIDGSVYSKDGKTLIRYRGDKTATSFTVPAGVETIGNRAFEDCESLTGVVIPNGVKTIGNQAFYNCTSLTGIVIPDSVVTINESAFEYCEKLTGVTIGNGVTSIGDHAFAQCYNLTNVVIGNSVKTIGAYAFYANQYGNPNLPLTSIVIPDSVTTIGEFAFCRSGIQSVVIGAGVTFIGSNAFDIYYDNENGYAEFKNTSGWTLLIVEDGIEIAIQPETLQDTRQAAIELSHSYGIVWVRAE